MRDREREREREGRATHNDRNSDHVTRRPPRHVAPLRCAGVDRTYLRIHLSGKLFSIMPLRHSGCTLLPKMTLNNMKVEMLHSYFRNIQLVDIFSEKTFLFILFSQAFN